MTMTDNEIVREYKAAKNKQHQIEILADLNTTSKDEIKKILKANGVNLRGGNFRAKKPIIEAADPVPGEIGYVEIISNTETKLPIPVKEPAPPLGLTPRDIAENLFNESRIRDIIEAMHRYYEADKEIPYEWKFELKDRL